jgi:signal peptidase II
MKLPYGLAVAVIVAVADQLSKAWILVLFAVRSPGERLLPVTGFFNLVLTWNRGMSFGLFNSNEAAFNTVIFTVIAAIIVAALVIWLRRVQQPLLVVAIGLVIGGAVGNVIDRLWRGAVVDFLDFYAAGWHFFAFNVADAAISVGVGLMVIDSLLARREVPN